MPARIVLSESSGPVSPPGQYFVEMTLTAGPAGVSLRREIERDWKGGTFRTAIDDEITVDRATYETLWADLLAAGAFDPTPPAKAAPARVGVSSNRLTLALGKQRRTIEFRSSDLMRDTKPAWLPLLERVRRLAKL
ncbi:MAG: hypothetical protein EOO75_11890 [Myxococcales bacterium]|nr:MAG: hypothetical protein EOO75_11890 [Myxococcales bacterium]